MMWAFRFKFEKTATTVNNIEKGTVFDIFVKSDESYWTDKVIGQIDNGF